MIANEQKETEAVHSDAPPAEPVPTKHGPLYWLVRNLLEKFGRFARKHKVFSAITTIVIAWSLFVFRAYWQPVLVHVRIHTPEILTFGCLAYYVLRSFRRKKFKRGIVATALLALLVLAQVNMDLPPLRHVTLYYRFKELNPVYLSELPTTDHERIQPLNSIRILSREAMKEVEQASEPHFVRVASHNGDEYRWTMGIEPSYHIPRLFGHVKEVLDVSGLASSPNFSGGNRVPVSFRVGESLLMGRNAHISTIRSFGLLRFLSYTPRDVRYLKDDKGEWVEVISLIRWRGIIFVWPEFGGVQVVRQTSEHFSDSIWGMVKSWFVGDGEWIRPEDIGSHAYLVGQNNVPYEVSQCIAHSLRFQNGFTDPLPFYHQGDTRIPDLPGDQNDQPFVTYFNFDKGTNASSDSKLYDYFDLEPYDMSKSGLNTSLMVPADGVGKEMIYQHFKVNEALTGVSAIGPKVMESRKQYDWEQSQPAENRPYIKDINGKRRFFWLTTVVTYRNKKEARKEGFVGGSTPQVTLTDALYKRVVWVQNVDRPASWQDDLRTELGDMWKSN